MEPERIIRTPLPRRTLRRLDELLETGAGGYESRAEFIREAVEQLLDVTAVEESTSAEPPAAAQPGAAHQRASDEAAPADLAAETSRWVPASERRLADPRSDHALYLERAVEPARARGSSEDPGFAAWLERIGSPADATITAPSRGAVIEGVPEGFEIDPGPLLGLHNRDWVSLWALQRLAEVTSDGPVGLDEFLAQVTDEAWRVAETLMPFEPGRRPRFTTGLPTNRAKPQATEEGFRSFAIGTLYRPRTDPDRRRLAGAFYTWRVTGVEARSPRELLIAPSAGGYELLEMLEGLSLDLPHGPQHAERFLGFLKANAPQDFRSFRILLETARRQPTRKDLIEVFGNEFAESEWTPSVASTNVAGCVARAREWGLLEERLDRGRYAATPFGLKLMSGDFPTG